MAVDLAKKRRTLTRELVQLCSSFMDVAYAMNALRLKRQDADGTGTPISFLDSDFEGIEGLEHLNAEIATTAFDAIQPLLTALASQNYGKKFEAVRK